MCQWYEVSWRKVECFGASSSFSHSCWRPIFSQELNYYRALPHIWHNTHLCDNSGSTLAPVDENQHSTLVTCSQVASHTATPSWVLVHFTVSIKYRSRLSFWSNWPLTNQEGDWRKYANTLFVWWFNWLCKLSLSPNFVLAVFPWWRWLSRPTLSLAGNDLQDDERELELDPQNY